MNLITRILSIIVAVSGILSIAFIFIPVSQKIQYIDTYIFILGLCIFGLIYTVKEKKHLFSILIGLIAIIFLIGLF